MDNSYLALHHILRLIEVPFTTRNLKEELNTHPEPGSLASISDTLTKYNVDSLGLSFAESPHLVGTSNHSAITILSGDKNKKMVWIMSCYFSLNASRNNCKSIVIR